MAGGSVGPQVLGAGETFLQEAEEFRGRCLPGGDEGHGPAHEPAQQHQGARGERREDQGQAPVELEEGAEDPDDQQHLGEDLQHQRGHHRGEPGDVAVDAVDEFAGRVALVEGGGPAQTVGHQVGAQPVGGAPGEPHGDGVAADGHHEQSEGRRQIPPGDREQQVGGASGQRVVDEPAHHLRCRQLEPDAKRDEHREKEDGGAFAAQIAEQYGQLP